MEGPLPPNDCPKLDLCKPLWPLAKLVGSCKTKKKKKHLIESLTKPNTPKTYDSQNQKLVKTKASITIPKTYSKHFTQISWNQKKTSQKFLKLLHASFWLWFHLQLSHASTSFTLMGSHTHILTHTQRSELVVKFKNASK